MPGIGGLSIADNLLANSVSLNLNRTQAGLQRSMTRLSSGLRVNSAADDPSGLAIAENLTSQVNGFDQGARNVQDANNAATVAEGALATIKTILQRARQLAVEASSDILSQNDRASLQTEVNQLLLEINRIVQNTTFNGQPLLDGSIAGYQPGQVSSATIESNSTLNTALPGNPASGQLVTVAATGDGAPTQEPQIDVVLKQNALGTGQPETLQVTSSQYIQPGEVFSAGNALVTVQSVDPTNGTITATFSAPVAVGTVMHGGVWGNSTNAVGAGEQIMNLASAVGDATVPLYAGEVLQVDPGGVNDIVKVQEVLSPTSFLADFGSAHPAGVQVYSWNGLSGISSAAPETVTFFAGTATDPPPVGSPAYVEESTSVFPPSNNVQVVGTGTVVSVTPTSETVYIPQITNLFGQTFTVITALGNANGPVVPSNDGTIELEVVDNNGSAAVKETYYDTASQTAQVSPYLIAPNSRDMYFNGTVIGIGNATLADVGQTAYVKVLQATAPLTNQQNGPLAIQAGSDEGSQIQIGIAAMNTAVLRISNTNLMSSISAEDGIGQIDYALDQVLSQSAQIGAVIVRLSEEEDNNNTASVNLQSSESNIMDLNVPQETTAFTKLQVLGQVGTSVLAQANTNAQSILALFR